MTTIETHGTFDEAIAASEPSAAERARELRGLIAEVFPDVVEVPWPKQNIIGYGIGPKKMTEHFCYIGGYRDHINLGFNHGALIPDPSGLLEGAGKTFRHVKIRERDDVRNPALKTLLAAAVEERKQAR